jgi:hypothetical protein
MVCCLHNILRRNSCFNHKLAVSTPEHISSSMISFDIQISLMSEPFADHYTRVWTPVSSTVVAGTTSVVSSPAWSYIPSSVAPSPATTWAVWSSTPVYTPAPVVSTPETTYAPVPVTTSVAPAPVTTYSPTTVAPVVSYTPTTPAPSVSSFLGAASHQKPAAALLAGVAGLVALL